MGRCRTGEAVIFFILVGAIAMIQNRLTRSKEVQQ